ncbi:uncharacterized protein LOC100575968 [Acyrthosiphon pisum]|uniref:Uncharacterized protein n=1 Tax=Acyrthosiphon pisum TaxID=7029 RepID=A0A8R2AAC1_ACYPI|nr:uncharacterized protein LOC100575968 [Acyrthosiphon pisum]|eukprot:XP_003243824.2 PREDICTED: uncharacterized protein LOC100575968 isoform X2 [Acyrthosiphon pisum]
MQFYYYDINFVMRCRMVVLIAFTVVIGWWPAVAVAWNTDRLYGTRMRARLTDVAVWRNRAYACWPRADASQPVTLLELPWPETIDEQSQQPSSWTPSRPFYADQQKLYDCHRVQSAVAVDLDKLRGHLYVLDNGYDNVKCQPKIIVYDLKTYKCIQSVELGGINGSGLATLVVDARPFKGETKVYVGDARGGHIMVFDPDRSVWYMVALRIQNHDRAVIQQNYYGPEVDSDVPSECIAVLKRQSSVYLTSRRSHNLYTASFKDLRNLTSYITPSIKNGDVLPVGLRVRWEGVKLGVSGGFYADIQGGLNYVYTRDFVAVRLSIMTGGVPVAAEDHKVLLQSYNLLPAVTKIFTDNTNYRQVWALNAMPNAENRHLVKINTL